MLMAKFDIVDISDVKYFLRIEHNEDDHVLNTLIASATERLLIYLDVNAKKVLSLDEDGLPTMPIPSVVATAAIIYVGILYKDIDQDTGIWRDGTTLPSMVTALLHPLRSSVLI